MRRFRATASIGRIVQFDCQRCGVRLLPLAPSWPIVVGWSNIFAALKVSAAGYGSVPRLITVGMLATVMNAITLQDALERVGVATRGCRPPSTCRSWRSPNPVRSGPFAT